MRLVGLAEAFDQGFAGNAMDEELVGHVPTSAGIRRL